MKRSILALGLFCASIALLGAVSGTATVVYAEGDEVTVIRDKREMKVEDPMGFVVEAGDIVQTGKNTVLELSVQPKKSVIRMSGNTTLQFRGSYATSETSLAVLYGRVRAKVEKLMGAERFTVRNEGTVCGVRGTDFAMEVVFAKDSDAGTSKVSLYCFEGSLAVDTALSANSPVQSSGVVKAGEMAESVVKGDEVTLASAAMTSEVRTAWDANAFKSEIAASIVSAASEPVAQEQPTETILALPETGTAKAESPEPKDQGAIQPETSTAVPKIDWSLEKKKLSVKNGMLGTSSFLVAAGAGIQIYGAYLIGIQENTEYANEILLAGSLCTTSGFLCGLFGLLWNPNIPPR